MTMHSTMQLDFRASNIPYSQEHLLAWSLLLMRAASKAGLTPMASHTFHRIHYFSNCLAVLYDSVPPIELVMKSLGGPFYPRAQNDLDRIYAMGLVDCTNLEWIKTEFGILKNANYDLSSKGFTLAEQMVRTLAWCTTSAEFLLDLCNAYVEIKDGKEEQALNKDLVYSQQGFKEGSVIPFRNWNTNLSARGADAFNKIVPPSTKLSRQHQLRLYMRYLEAAA